MVMVGGSPTATLLGGAIGTSVMLGLKAAESRFEGAVSVGARNSISSVIDLVCAPALLVPIGACCAAGGAHIPGMDHRLPELRPDGAALSRHRRAVGRGPREAGLTAYQRDVLRRLALLLIEEIAM